MPSEGGENTAVAVQGDNLTQSQKDAQNALAKVKNGDNDINAFVAVALLLKSFREQLEGVKFDGQPPRWVRISKASTYKGEVIADGVITITGGLLKAIGFLGELTIKAQELLDQIDSGKALIEVGAEMIKTVMDDEFLSAVQKSVGIENPTTGIVPAGVKDGVDAAMGYMEYIPDPEDVEVVAKEIYKLLAVGEKDLGNAPVDDDSANVFTGKIRLLSWCLEKSISCHGITGGVEVTQLGMDRGSLSGGKYLLEWTDGEKTVKCGEVTYENGVSEQNAILTKLGYAENDLTDFQTENNLENKDGNMDLFTANQLLNLDYKSKTLRKAKKKA